MNWISIEETWPNVPINVPCWVYSKKSSIPECLPLAIKIFHAKHSPPRINCLSALCQCYEQVTHYMPVQLPNSPNKENNDADLSSLG